MDRESDKRLVVGLGNPGKKYGMTRHNFGQMVLYAFAEKHHFLFKKERKFLGEISQGVWNKERLFLLFPTTYMNLSGRAVRKSVDFYKIPLERVLILSDDVALPFGSFRLRKRGSAGGHNGLKSVEEAVGTRDYSRLRLGVGEGEVGVLEEYVLAPFTKEEQEQLPKMIAQGVICLEEWLSVEQKKEFNEERAKKTL